LQYSICENQNIHEIHFLVVSIFGDLKDFNIGRTNEIEDWLKRALLSEHYFVSEGVILIRDSSVYLNYTPRKEIILRIRTKNDYKFHNGEKDFICIEKINRTITN